MSRAYERASVIGSGPNGLAAAVALARAGLQVDVYEAERQIGGGARTMELTLPGFRHDFGSAVHPMAAGSPFFNSLGLEGHGLQWIHSPAPLAHVLDDGTAVLLERSVDESAAALGPDGGAWRSLVEPFAERWPEFAREVLAPPLHIPRSPLLLARFGRFALEPAVSLARRRFSAPRTRALFAGLAAHSMLALDQPLTSAMAIVLAGSAHAMGWPVPRGGAQAISDAVAAELTELGGAIHAGRRISTLDEIQTPDAAIFCDVTPRQLLSLAGGRLPAGYAARLRRFRYGPGAFKIDYALSEPIPWRAPECSRAITVHVGGPMEEVAQSEASMARGEVAGRPFLLVAQPSLFDPTRAPAGKHVAWVYCHVPHGSMADMTARIEAQLERFAPGFRDCVLARSVLGPAALENMDANLVGGDIGGGEFSLRQFLLRPALRPYDTGAPGLYLCSASTPPGGGVHGMCGYWAAETLLRARGGLRQA